MTAAAIDEALAALVAEKPYLASKGRTPSVEQGPQGNPPNPNPDDPNAWLRNAIGH